ncbi:diacylglycerol/lipid kinase family protein [Pengzhenrongella sicca]|uniref:NAD(+)/NADH kinase n=1 Tax=Pengzhenrongella sicca TaxID=2819238 RepID=A0A8A4ZCD6_9MICO|nr:diacylglycerol kinase family protein [Pengzhenrongella sicca]QTE29592.1 NAD(+)/NADH kinase [Pengzhenrongella sicca]
MSRPEWISLIALVLAVGAIVVAALAIRRAGGVRGARSAAATAAAAEHQPSPEVTGDLVAFVANPTKAGASALRDAAIRACAARNMPEPLWYETTLADPGVGQARAAIARGAVVVVAVGGDGTVRAVAEALAGTQVPMGLIPQGTGNLLARNLDLPLTDADAALGLALTGTGRTIDVGWLRVERDGATVDGAPVDGATVDAAVDDAAGAPAASRAEPPAQPTDHIFLVIAGLGFDAAMVADTDEVLKARVGWIAYFVAGARHLHGRRLHLRITVDGAPATALRVRSLLVGNCGRLPGGITLLPDAVLDDGWLDIGAIDTRGGLAGWAQLFGEVVLQGVGMRNGLPGKIGRIDHSRARRLRVVADRPEAVQVDGDVLGRAREITVRVDPGALTVRVA